MSNYCPSSFSSTLDRTKSLGCNRTYQYHCMRNKEDGMVEKCLKISWIQEDDCAVYDTDAKTIDAWPCDITRGVCPQEQYLSNEVMSYSACVPLSPPTNGTYEGNVHEINTNNIQLESDDEGIPTGIIIAIVCIFVICIVLVAAVFIHFRRKCRAGNTNQDEENADPLIQRDNPSKKDDEEEQKIKHLEKEEEQLKYFECKGECPRHMLKTIKVHLQNQTSVFIIGKPGSGKTTLAWTLCKQMHGEIFEGTKWYVKASTSFENLPDKEEKLILLLDGRFESAWTTEGMVKKVSDELQGLKNKLQCEKILTVATMSLEAYERISKYDCVENLKPVEIIDLDRKRNTFTRAEMARVFESCGISVRNFKDSKEDKALNQKQLYTIYQCFNYHTSFWRRVYAIPELGFPLIACLMSLYSPFRGNMKFVQEPIKHILKSIKQLRMSQDRTDKNKYCSIVYALFNWGYVDINNVDQELLTKIGKQHDHHGAEIDPDFYILRKRTATVYEFLHESLLQLFFAAYGIQYFGFVIAHCPLDVLLEYSLSSREKPISEKELIYFLRIGGIEYEKDLIHRIRDAKVDIQHHRIWEQTDFQEIHKSF